MTDTAFLRCINPDCAKTLDISIVDYACPKCGSLLDVAYDWAHCLPPGEMNFFAHRWATRNRPIDFSGVWRFRELLPFATPQQLVTIGEGQTLLQSADAAVMGLALREGHLFLQYEGMNPSGSFKDNGMTAAFTMARKLGKTRVGCASTGNTSASMALYASLTSLANARAMQAIVFVGAAKIAMGKLAQALDYGATTLQIAGDFDACMTRIRETSQRLGLYLMNSVNPFRLEGQKTIMYRVLEALDWQPPDWIVVPGGNLGNTSAFGKAFMELQELELISRVPQLAVVNATGANTLCELVTRRGLTWNGGRWNAKTANDYDAEMKKDGRKAKTIASAIEIAQPVNLPKALRALEIMNGVVCEVTDEEIMNAKAQVGRHGFGCEPASAASVAGLRQLLEKGIIARDARVVCILTGHALKDPDATVAYHASGAAPRRFSNAPISVADDIEAICRAIESAG